ncbi:MAG TPA: spermidine/putrescine ABC transporter substrate-binding protein [Gemmatimonadales bacterium]|nr:spermidine/putrescine ABC transporter substrate-binding protein [Gemmatimonadales bacterium]
MDTRIEIELLLSKLGEEAISRRAFARRALSLGVSASSIGLLLQACGREAANSDSLADLGQLEKELNIYNWSDYIADDTVSNFEREFGVKVTYDTYESNEEMVAKLMAGAGGYDIVVPSGYIIPVLVGGDLIRPLQQQYLTNLDNISPLFQDLPGDPGGRHTVPWLWGTSGIAYRADRVEAPVDSWAVFHDPRYYGKTTMMDDGREVIGSQLRYRGHSLNSTNSAELAQARADAIAAKKGLKAYISAPVKSQLISGDVWISQLWNGDTNQARTEQPHLEYTVPKEGCTIWVDSMCIPRGARHPRAAHEWINYLLRPEVGAALSEATGYGTPNPAAARLMKNPVPYPTDVELRRLEYPVDLGRHTAVWDRIWTEIKAA